MKHISLTPFSDTKPPTHTHTQKNPHPSVQPHILILSTEILHPHIPFLQRNSRTFQHKNHTTGKHSGST